jgi:hypothetical protein
MASATTRERRVGKVLVVGNVVRLVLEAERRRVELAPHHQARKAGNGFVPAGERVVVVESETMAPRRAVGRCSHDLDPGLAQAL